jgi:HTH-type transcriptional regulator, sugar sensing transcriptional regulator
MELIQQLKQFGYTEYEAKAYVALVTENPATAYQVSKISGIPRARIYDTLDSLAEKGLAMKGESPAQIMYVPVPVSVFLQKASQHWQHNFDSIAGQLKALETQQPEVENKVLVIKNRDMILSYCKDLLQRAENRVLLSMWDDVYEELREELERVAKQAKIHGITLHVKHPLATLDQHRTTHFTEMATTAHWFILSIDGKEMVYGPSPSDRELAFYTDDPVHIYLLEDYIWHDVLVNRLVRKSTADLGDWITAERQVFFLEE